MRAVQRKQTGGRDESSSHLNGGALEPRLRASNTVMSILGPQKAPSSGFSCAQGPPPPRATQPGACRRATLSGTGHRECSSTGLQGTPALCSSQEAPGPRATLAHQEETRNCGFSLARVRGREGGRLTSHFCPKVSRALASAASARSHVSTSPRNFSGRCQTRMQGAPGTRFRNRPKCQGSEAEAALLLNLGTWPASTPPCTSIVQRTRALSRCSQAGRGGRGWTDRGEVQLECEPKDSVDLLQEIQGRGDLLLRSRLLARRCAHHPAGTRGALRPTSILRQSCFLIKSGHGGALVIMHARLDEGTHGGALVLMHERLDEGTHGREGK